MILPKNGFGSEWVGITLKAALYIRVSTEEQAREGYSIAAQKERLLAYARAQDWEVVDLYVDEGISGATMDRPALTRLRQGAQEKQFDIVLVWKVDRLSRKVSHLSALVEELDEVGVTLKSATEPFDTGHAAGRAFLHMLSTFAELERETIRERVTMGIHRRVQDGYVHGRPPMFGYAWSPGGLLEVVPEQAAVVKHIYRRYQEGAGMTKIAQELHVAKDIPVPAELMGPGTSKHYDRLKALRERIAWILKNPIYAGRTNINGDTYSGRHEAIIPLETWEEVQRIREDERKVPNRAKRSHYPLAGLIVCGNCGGPMYGYRQPNRASAEARQCRPFYEYYICQNSTQARGRAKTCINWGMNKQRVEEAVLVAIETYARTADELAAAYVGADKPTPDPSGNDRQREQASLESQLRAVGKKRAKWFRAFEGDESMEDVALERLRELADEERKLKQRLEKLEQEQPTRPPDLDRASILRMARDVRILFSEAGPDDQRQLCRLFVREVRVFKDKQVEVDLFNL